MRTPRTALFRGARHPESDPLDSRIRNGTVISLITVNFVIMVPAMSFAFPVFSGNALFTVMLIGLAVDAVIMRGIWLIGQRWIRPRVFDREQRVHEIVPTCERTDSSV